MNLRFIEARRTSMKLRGGWAVPPNFGKGRDLRSRDLIENLDQLGLVLNTDYRILEYGRYGHELITRVMFETDEAFLMAKMCYG